MDTTLGLLGDNIENYEDEEIGQNLDVKDVAVSEFLERIYEDKPYSQKQIPVTEIILS